jgi:trehalose/maltose hydrolase-like predicted phosphorylase
MSWIIDEKALGSMDFEARAVVFTLGNGLIELNGSGPLDPPGSGWSLHGRVYAEASPQSYYFPPAGSSARSKDFPTDRDCMRYVTPILLLLPNVFGLRMRFAGRRVQRPLTTHRRLRMRDGVLETLCEVVVPEGELTVKSVRAMLPDERNVVVERIEITSDRDGELEVELALDALRLAGDRMTGDNLYEVRCCREGRVTGKDSVVWSGEGEGTGDRASVAMSGRGEGLAGGWADAHGAGLRYTRTLKAGQPAVFDRYVSVAAEWMHKDYQTRATQVAAGAACEGVEALLTDVAGSWAEYWNEQDIVIEGCEEDQQAVRYALFQLRCATSPTHLLSFGAKFLSGEGYRDCVFWDTDVFIVPYFTRCRPDVSRRHALFRHHGLPAARFIAKTQGFDGARYPWEALPDGEEALGPWVVLSRTQVHVVCDVAWSILDYHRWTGDDAFMRAEGAEILADTARFWVSRVTKTPRGYELHGVCGPDEAHEEVNNNVYTNLLARENLRAAAAWNPADPQREDWLKIAEALFIPTPRADGLLEAWEGFFDLEDSMGVERIPGNQQNRQMCKQADVLMLPLLMPGFLSPDQVAANYAYYEPRTWHWSSLSEAAHAQVAARIGHTEEAYRMFRNNLITDLADRQNSTRRGLHAAALGMVPRNIMEGFAGLRLEGDKPVLEPRLPSQWEAISFVFYFRGHRYFARVNKGTSGKITLLPSEVLDNGS